MSKEKPTKLAKLFSWNTLTLVITVFNALILLAPYHQALAVPRWELVLQEGNGDRVFIDRRSKLQVGNMITLWMLEDYKNGQQDYTKRWYSLTSKNIFDCPARVYRRIHTSAYNGSMGYGQIVRARLLNSKWVPVKSGKLFAAICTGFKRSQ